MKDGTVKDSTIKASTVKASTVKASTVKAGAMKAGTVKEGTVKAGTVKAGTVKEGTVKGTAEGEKWMLKEPNMDAGMGLEVDARMGAKRVCSEGPILPSGFASESPSTPVRGEVPV